MQDILVEILENTTKLQREKKEITHNSTTHWQLSCFDISAILFNKQKLSKHDQSFLDTSMAHTPW